MKKFVFTAVTIAFLVLGASACNVIKDISKTIENIQRLEFKLENVKDFSLAGVNLSRVSSLGDLSISQGLKLTNSFRKKKLPADFTLMLNAKNPNDGSGKSKQTKATIKNIDWRLFIDGVETISGVVNDNIVVPGNGSAVDIPIRMDLDLYDFFGNKGYDRLINLALTLGGSKGSSSKITLDIKPTVSTGFGNIRYPGRIKVVDKQWKN